MAHGGMKLVKLLLFLFNFIFWLSGLGLIAFGIVIEIQNANYYNVLGNTFLAASNVLIVCGCIVAVLGFFGCCGAIRENYCMTMTFAILLGIMLTLELAAGIASYVLRNDLENTLTKQVNEGMNNYLNSTFPPDHYTLAWDYVQQHLNCCGTTNYTDWESKKAFHTVPLGPRGSRLLPYSCCSTATVNDACYTSSADLHSSGCIDQLKKWAEINIAYLGCVALGVALIQMIELLLSRWYSMRLRYEDNYHPYHEYYY